MDDAACGRARPCKRRRRRACRRESRKVRDTRIASRKTRHACTGLDEVLSIHSFIHSPSWMARAVNGRGRVRDGRAVVKVGEMMTDDARAVFV